MWLLLGLAFGILAIVLVAGHPTPSDRRAATPATEPVPLNAGLVRDYQDRLRVLDHRARQEPVTHPLVARPQSAGVDSPPAAAPDAVDAEQRRRAYESLFASNVVLSRRPEAQPLMTPGRAFPRTESTRGIDGAVAAPPSLDEVADAVMRASARYAPPTAGAPLPNMPADGALNSSATAPGPASIAANTRPTATGPITSTGPLHRILEGTVIETVLTNRLDGGVAAPLNCLVTTPVYSHDGQVVLIPAGSRVLGKTTPVQGFGDTRLAVAFHRLALPDGRTYPLDQFMGLNDMGDAGLRDHVNQHYRSTFGASAAVGLMTGFAQYLGSVGLNRGAGDRTVVMAGNVGDATAQATAHTMNRFLNRLPTVTIREGHRIKVYLTSDLELPAYDARTGDTRPLVASVR
jgi:type IV secretion system protein VirB10